MTEAFDQITERIALHVMPPVVHDLFRALDGSPTRFGLVGGHCSHCGQHFFPKPEHCSTCHGTVSRTVFGERGRIHSFTVVRTKAPFSLPEPYAVGYIDLADVALRVFSLLDPASIDQLSVGAPVRLNVIPLGCNGKGEPCLRPVYALSQGSSCKEAL